MKKGLLVLLLAAVAAGAIVYSLRVTETTSNASVTGLLPRGTIMLAHIPDFNRTRDEWHRSDIYQLYKEPAVQDFLNKPLTRVPKADSFSQTLHDFDELEAKDGFLAVTALNEQNQPKVVAGLRFRGSQEEADKVIGRWKTTLLGSAQRETIDYQQHKIETAKAGPASVATAYDGQWFFAASDLEELKAVLDRADGRIQDKQTLLTADETFRAALTNVSNWYAALLYLQPKLLAEKLTTLRQSKNADTMFEQIRCVCLTTRFDDGKMHDIAFVGMPKQVQDSELTRASIILGTRDTFLYAATLLNLPRQFALFDPSTGANFLGAGLQKIGRALLAAGLTPEEWKTVFGSEVGVLSDWPDNVHWPTVLFAWPVKDAARARKAAVTLARSLDDDGQWTETDKDGVHYISTPYTTGFLTMRPTVAVSDKMMVAGFDISMVEAAMQRSASGSSGLTDSPAYKKVVGLVPAPTNFFAYLDLGLLYARVDTTLRPMLVMGAAFMPWISDYVDVGKLPPVEVVTKHMSPIVSSTTYKNDGYRSESVGPITLNQAGLGAAVLTIGFGVWRQQQTSGGTSLPSLGAGGGATSSPGGGWSGKGYPVPASPQPSPSGTP